MAKRPLFSVNSKVSRMCRRLIVEDDVSGDAYTEHPLTHQCKEWRQGSFQSHFHCTGANNSSKLSLDTLLINREDWVDDLSPGSKMM